MEELRKNINMQILIVAMLIITISSTVSTVLIAKLLVEIKNNSNVSTSVVHKDTV